MYDITSKKSLLEAEKYMEDAVNKFGVAGDRCFVIGNKNDLETDRQVTYK